MEACTFTYDEIFTHNRAPLFRQFLQLRKRVFVDGLSWSLNYREDLESDQYDNPNAQYVMIVDAGIVVAGARLMPADQDWHGWTHFLKDSALGKIAGMPQNLFPKDFDFLGSYECSRLVLDHDRLPQEQQHRAFHMLSDAFCDLAQRKGFGTYLSLSPAPLLRKFRGMGLSVDSVGRKYICQDDGRTYRILRLCNLTPALAEAA